METARTQLRRLTLEDLKNMRNLESDSRVVRFTPSRVPQSEEQTRERLVGQMEKQTAWNPFGIWVAEEKLTGIFLGWFMLIPTNDKRLELGFMLIPSAWGKGFTTEICRVLVEFVRSQIDIKGIVAHTDLENSSSIKVLRKLGFQESNRKLVPEKVFGGEVELRVFNLNFD